MATTCGKIQGQTFALFDRERDFQVHSNNTILLYLIFCEWRGEMDEHMAESFGRSRGSDVEGMEMPDDSRESQDAADLLAHPRGDDQLILDPVALSAWLQQRQCPGFVIDILILSLLRVQRTIEVDPEILGKVCLMFSIFSARLLFSPLWTTPFIPAVSPIYEHGPVS